MAYKLIKPVGIAANFPAGIIRTSDGASIPASDDNSDWRQYQAWLKAGNVPIAADDPPAGPVLLPTAVFLGRLTPKEYVAIRKASSQALASGDSQIEMWLDMARATPAGVNLVDPATLAVKASMVSSGLLTQARADIVFAPQ